MAKDRLRTVGNICLRTGQWVLLRKYQLVCYQYYGYVGAYPYFLQMYNEYLEVKTCNVCNLP